MPCAEPAAGATVKRRRVRAFAVAALVAIGSAGTGAAGDTPTGLGWLRELAGACWIGERADGTPADTQCYEMQFDRHLRGTIEIPGVAGAPPRLRGDSVWSWEPARRTITVAMWSSLAPVSVTEATLDGDLVRFSSGPNARSTWHRTGPDGYTVVLERREGAGWREDRRVSYRRVPR